MNSSNQNSSQNIQDRFPKMRPVKNTPALFRINGCGVGMYGRRDHDMETNCYVKTHCLCLVFIPILALGAYRVVDAERGWYFIGKEPLSNFARRWNWAMAYLSAICAVMISWNSYTSSPTYVARQQLQEASKALESGKSLRAAAIYRHVAEGFVLVPEAREGLKASLEKAFQSKSPADIAAGFNVLKSAPSKLNKPEPLIPNAFERGVKLIEQFKTSDPEGALTIFDAVAAVDPTNLELPGLHKQLLKGAITANPQNTPRVVELASIYETEGNALDCFKLLSPCADKLGSTEGARILGQIYLKGNDYEKAYTFLFAYVQPRLEELHGIERGYTNALTSAYNRGLNALRNGAADRSFYTKYDSASKVEKGQMVEEFIARRVQTDSSYQRALHDLKAANRIITVTLDLGIVQVNRAQNLQDPAKRKAELEAAEKTFLAIQGLAGKTDEYRLFLGKVYYWLGKSSEGKELFDELLTSNKRSHRILMSLGNTLRDVGERTQAAELAEEAYRSGKDNKEKYEAASFRALACTDQDDQITWLEKADPDQLWVQIELNSARGSKALETGDKAKAASYLRKAVEGYANTEKSPASLNNGGLASMHLYQATGDLRDYDHGISLLEEAVSMSPGDSILLMNTADILIQRALMDVTGEFIDFQALKEPPQIGMLSHLYADQNGRQTVFERLHNNPTLRKGMALLDKAQILSPKTASLYELEVEWQNYFRETSEIQKLRQRVTSAALTLKEDKSELKEVLSGSKDQHYNDIYRTELRKFRALLDLEAVHKHPLMEEFVRTTILNLEQNSGRFGTKVDPREILADALNLNQKHSDSATVTCLQNAYFYAAHQDLIAHSPEYASIAKQTDRILNPEYLMLLLMQKDGPLSDLIARNENVGKAAQICKENCAKFPSFPHVTDWALLWRLDPSAAKPLESALEQNTVLHEIDEIDWQLTPLHANTVVHHYLTLQMRGEKAKAVEVYRAAIADGLPLPTL